jgi:predicted GNAT superfamily acetyltransferase
MSEVAIVPVERARMRECEQLARDVFGFGPGEAIPAWFVDTATRVGGVARAAIADDAVVGFFFAFPGVERGRPLLFLTELAVSPPHRGRGVARRLLAELRAAALARGCTRVQLTTNPLSARNLHLYLTRCGARIVAYHPLLYGDLIDGADGDEVELAWDLADEGLDARLAGRAGPGVAAGALPGHVLTRTVERDGVRVMGEQAASVRPRGPRCLVEIPWDADALDAAAPPVRDAWRAGVRAAMATLLAAGYRGVDVAVDEPTRRAFVVFAR